MTSFQIVHDEDAINDAIRRMLAAGGHARLAQMARHWQSLRPPMTGEGGRLPARRHFDPVAIQRLMPAAFLADVERQPLLRFRCRLIGTKIARLFPKDPTGAYADVIMPGIEGTVLGVALASVVETGLPNHGGGPVVLIPGKDHLKIERLLLPLADDGRTVDMVLGVVVLTYENGRELV